MVHQSLKKVEKTTDANYNNLLKTIPKPFFKKLKRVKKHGFCQRVRLGQSMILLKKNWKKMSYFFKSGKKIEKRGFGPGLGQVSLGQAVYFTKENQFKAKLKSHVK